MSKATTLVEQIEQVLSVVRWALDLDDMDGSFSDRPDPSSILTDLHYDTRLGLNLRASSDKDPFH